MTEILTASGSNVDNNSFDRVFTIPSFAEGFTPLRMLESITSQSNQSNERLAAILVLNNASDSAAEERRANNRTHVLIQNIWDSAIPDGLDTSDEVYPGSPESRIAAMEVLFQSQVQFLIVDLWRGKNAPEKCSVGYARDIGGKVAADLAKRADGVVAFSDADSFYTPGSLNGIANAYQNRDTCAATGPVSFFEERGYEKAAKLRKLWIDFVQLQDDLLVLHREDLQYQLRKPPQMFWGANMSMRPEILQEVGFDHINGGEDKTVAFAIQQLGKEITFEKDIHVYSSARSSLRAQKGCGVGQRIALCNNYADECADYPTGSLVQRSYIFECCKYVDEASRAHATEADWKDAVRNFCFVNTPMISSTELDSLWQEQCRAPHLSTIRHNALGFRVVRSMAEQRYPNVRLEAAIMQLEDGLPSDSASLRSRFDGICARFESLKSSH